MADHPETTLHAASLWKNCLMTVLVLKRDLTS